MDNRYDFLYLFDCSRGNPNGDPHNGNVPRMDFEDQHGLVSDVALKRRVRDYVSLARGDEVGNAIFVQHTTNLNRQISKSHEQTGGLVEKATKSKVAQARDYMCKTFFDVRTFGAVLSTGANAGQVRGPVQLGFSRSIDPIQPIDIGLTRVACAKELVGKNQSSAAYEAWENAAEENTLRGMGRKSIIAYGLYACEGSVSANVAEQTGFSDDDLTLFWESLANMWEHARSASKGLMSARELIVFKHVGFDPDPEKRAKQAKLGCGHSHLLFEAINVERTSGAVARKFSDYVIDVGAAAIPEGVEVWRWDYAAGQLVRANQEPGKIAAHIRAE